MKVQNVGDLERRRAVHKPRDQPVQIHLGGQSSPEGISPWGKQKQQDKTKMNDYLMCVTLLRGASQLYKIILGNNW